MSVDTQIPDNDPVIIMSRTFDASPELVWEAITDPRHVRAWWGGAGASNPVCEMDLWPGGIWTQVMRLPGGEEMHMRFEFVSVEAPKRLVWKDASERSSMPVPPPVITISLESRGHETLWTMEARFLSIEARDAAVAMGFAQPIAESAKKLVGYIRAMKGGSQ